MKRAKYYAIIEGYRRGLTDSWPMCKRCVSGYAQNWYKGFRSVEEAARYMKRNLPEYEGPYLYEADGECQEFWYKSEFMDFLEEKLEEQYRTRQSEKFRKRMKTV